MKIFQEQKKAKEKLEPIAEQVAEGTGSISKDYREEVLATMLALPPAGFERLAQRFLRESGFTQVVVTGQSGDGGIDGFGILQVNPLVSFKVLSQCKRYAKSVAPSQVRDFRGAMSGRADKGIIITTGTFTQEAKREATRDGAPPIELIDGEKHIDMLENLELGLKAVTTYEVEHAFFSEFKAQPFAQVGHKQQATGPGLAVRDKLSPARAWRPAVVARFTRTIGLRLQHFRHSP